MDTDVVFTGAKVNEVKKAARNLAKDIDDTGGKADDEVKKGRTAADAIKEIVEQIKALNLGDDEFLNDAQKASNEAETAMSAAIIQAELYKALALTVKAKLDTLPTINNEQKVKGVRNAVAEAVAQANKALAEVIALSKKASEQLVTTQITLQQAQAAATTQPPPEEDSDGAPSDGAPPGSDGAGEDSDGAPPGEGSDGAPPGSDGAEEASDGAPSDGAPPDGAPPGSDDPPSDDADALENIKIQARGYAVEATELQQKTHQKYENAKIEVKSTEYTPDNIKSYELNDNSFENQAREAYEKARQALNEAKTTGNKGLKRVKMANKNANKAIDANNVGDARDANNAALGALNAAKTSFKIVVDKLKIVNEECEKIRKLQTETMLSAVQMKKVFLTQAQTEIKDAQTSRGEIKDKVDKMEEKRTKCDEIINELKQQLDTVQKLVIPEGSNADVSNKKTECLTEISAQEDIVNYEKNEIDVLYEDAHKIANDADTQLTEAMQDFEIAKEADTEQPSIRATKEPAERAKQAALKVKDKNDALNMILIVAQDRLQKANEALDKAKRAANEAVDKVKEAEAPARAAEIAKAETVFAQAQADVTVIKNSNTKVVELVDKCMAVKDNIKKHQGDVNALTVPAGDTTNALTIENYKNEIEVRFQRAVVACTSAEEFLEKANQIATNADKLLNDVETYKNNAKNPTFSLDKVKEQTQKAVELAYSILSQKNEVTDYETQVQALKMEAETAQTEAGLQKNLAETAQANAEATARTAEIAKAEAVFAQAQVDVAYIKARTPAVVALVDKCRAARDNIKKHQEDVNALIVPAGDTTNAQSTIQTCKNEIEVQFQKVSVDCTSAEECLQKANQIETNADKLLNDVETYKNNAKNPTFSLDKVKEQTQKAVELANSILSQKNEITNYKTLLTTLETQAKTAETEAASKKTTAEAAKANADTAAAAYTSNLNNLKTNAKTIKTPKLLSDITLLEGLESWEVGMGQVRMGDKHDTHKLAPPFQKYPVLKSMVSKAYDSINNFNEGQFVQECMTTFDKERPQITGKALDAWDTRKMQEFEARRHNQLAEVTKFAQEIKSKQKRMLRDFREALASQLHPLSEGVAKALDTGIAMQDAIRVLEEELDMRNNTGAHAHIALPGAP
jgi:hypothetical protein